MDPITMAAIMSSLGGLFGNQAAGRIARTQQNFNQQQSQVNPFGFQGPTGGLGFVGNQGFATQTPEQQQLMQAIQTGSAGFLQGAQDPNALQSLQQPFNQQQSLLNQQQGSTAFGGLQAQQQQNTGLLNQFAQSLMQGPQDLTGGAQQGLFATGARLLGQAGNTSGLVQQNLDASRALAQPFEQRQQVAAQDSIFGRTRGATTGSRQEFADLLNTQNMTDQQRIMNAQQLGLQQQNQMGNLGIQAFGQGTNLFGQNLNAFGQQMQGFGQTANLGRSLEGQAFDQQLQSLGFNQSAGQNRLQNAMNMFNLGETTSQNRFQTGLQGQGGLNDQQALMQSLFLGSLGADADRIGAQADFSNANATLAGQRGEAAQGFFSNLFSDARLKENITKIGTLGDLGWYEWEWNDEAKRVGADTQPNFGVIAQEVEKTKPNAVSMYRGYLTVNYQEIY
jgi:hypothetical protein